MTDNHGYVLAPLPVAPVNETDMVLLPKGLNALKQVAKEVGLDLRGAYVNLDGGFDSRANRKAIFNTGRHAAYDTLVDQVMSLITDPKQMESYSSPDHIAEVVYEAATDGKDQLRYVAGADAKATYAMRLQMGDEAFRKAMEKQFFG